MAAPSTALPKMMLGFVVRRCAVALGHEPSPEEFAMWANHYRQDGRIVCVFGRPITEQEARVILRHRGRAVTARSAAPHECLRLDEPALERNVVSFENAAARWRARRQRTR